jgi:hypothetical protein
VIEASVWFSAWICHPLFGFDCLMQAFRPAPPVHQASGKFIDDGDFTLLHNILLVAVIQIVCTQCSIQSGA